MKKVAEVHMSMRQYYSGQYYPLFWDSPSYAENLKWAYEGFPESVKFKLAGEEIVSKLKQSNNGVLPPPGGSLFAKKKSLQQDANVIMMKYIFPNNDQNQIKELVKERLTKVFRPYVIDLETDSVLDVAFDMLKQLKASDSMKVIKTWLNGWTTSHRMREDITFDCLLGCNEGRDTFSHYVMCPHLFHLMRYFLPNCSSCPLVRLGVAAPIRSSLLTLACTFSAYHALKSKVSAGSIRMQGDSQTKIVKRLAWSVFAEAFAAEAGECHLNPRSFSLPKFINFLVTGVFPSQEDAPPVPLNSPEEQLSELHDHRQT